MAAIAVALLPRLAASASGQPPGTPEATAQAPEQRAGPAASSDPKQACAEKLAATIQSHYDAVEDFSATFKQQTRSVTLGNASLGADAPSRGTVQFAKPGKMRWRYESPTPSEVISNGASVWIYDATTREAQRLPVTEGYLTGAALEFLLGDGKILEEFHVEAPSCVPDADNALQLRLVPKAPASFVSLGLRANRETGEILSSSLTDLFGNETSISFTDARRNQHPPASTFEFVVPSGVVVIDLTPAP